MDQPAIIACCLICTLSAAMRDCPLCAFKAGLTVKADQDEKAPCFVTEQTIQKENES